MSAGTMVRILVGRLRGTRGEIVNAAGGVYTVRFSGGSATFRARELEAIR